MNKITVITLCFVLFSLNLSYGLTFNSAINHGHITQTSARIAQGPTFNISCDIENGESFQQDNISSINWTVTGFETCLYVLKDNGVEDFFGTIMENHSFRIEQELTNLQGWHSFSIHIHSGGIQIAELYVVIEIIAPANPWIINLPWILASVAVVSSTTLNIYLSRKREQKHGRGVRDSSYGPRQRGIVKQEQKTDVSIEKYPARADIIIVKNSEENTEWDFISSTRIEKIWIFTPTLMSQLYSHLYRLDRMSSSKETSFDEEVLTLFQKMLDLSIPEEPFFVNVPGLEDSERLLTLQIQNKMFVAILLCGRISSSYLSTIISTFRKYPSLISENLANDLSKIQRIVEESLHLSRSYSYVRSGPATDSLLRDSGLFTLKEDQSVWDEVQQLTFPECDEIIQKIRKKNTDEVKDSYYDDAEVLHGDD